MLTHDYKLIYIHIPKCAGRSVADMFNQRFEHLTANFYATTYSTLFNEYDKFTIVRNPYSRLVSMYTFISEHRRFSKAPVAAGTDGSKAQFKTWLVKNLTAYKEPFNLNSIYADIGRDEELGSPFWFSPQLWYLSGYQSDFKIFKIERLHELDLWLEGRPSQFTGTMPIKKITVCNKSNHGEWAEYYDSYLLDFLVEQPTVFYDCQALGYDLIDTKNFG